MKNLLIIHLPKCNFACEQTLRCRSAFGRNRMNYQAQDGATAMKARSTTIHPTEAPACRQAGIMPIDKT
jgi:hypothetical protein